MTNQEKMDLLESFTEVVTNGETMAFVTRAIELQEQARNGLISFLESLAIKKQECVDRNDEDGANMILALELMSQGVCSELDMWIAIKNEEMDEAWDHLITAQDYMLSAPLAHSVGKNAKRRVPLLEAIEHLVFPPQGYFSSGFLVKRAKCSICGEDYNCCDHIKGRAYMGELCFNIIEESELLDISAVINPADKRCRAFSFSDEAGMRDKMTWVVSSDEESGDRQVKGVIFSLNKYLDMKPEKS